MNEIGKLVKLIASLLLQQYRVFSSLFMIYSLFDLMFPKCLKIVAKITMFFFSPLFFIWWCYWSVLFTECCRKSVRSILCRIYISINTNMQLAKCTWQWTTMNSIVYLFSFLILSTFYRFISIFTDHWTVFTATRT